LIFFFKLNGTFINKPLNQLSKGMCWLSVRGEQLGRKLLGAGFMEELDSLQL